MNSSQATSVVVFRLGGSDYAVDIGQVKEICSASGLGALPNANPVVAGMINLRGEVIPVFHASSILKGGREEPGASAKILLLEHHGEEAGLLTDSVTRIANLGAQEAVEPEEITWEARLTDGTLVELVNLDRLMSVIRSNASMETAVPGQ